MGMNLQPTGALSPDRIAELLAEARARTRLLVSPLSEDDLRLQHDALMSPIVWDLGHIGHFEEVWLVESLDTGGDGSEGLRGMYNPFENPRSTRDDLALPEIRECWEYMGRIRRYVLQRLGDVDPSTDPELLRDGFVYRMVLQHEYQHNETILQTLQLKRGKAYPAVPAWTLPEAPEEIGGPEMVRFPGGRVEVGTDDRSAAYDNERPRHEVTLDPFWMDRTPVTNGAYAEFVAEGGYERSEYWTEEGWAWLQEEAVQAPKHWSRGADGWTDRVLDRVQTLDPRRPVCHVCYHEADAFARWAAWLIWTPWASEPRRSTRIPRTSPPWGATA